MLVHAKTLRKLVKYFFKIKANFASPIFNHDLLDRLDTKESMMDVYSLSKVL